MSVTTNCELTVIDWDMSTLTVPTNLPIYQSTCLPVCLSTCLPVSKFPLTLCPRSVAAQTVQKRPHAGLRLRSHDLIDE